MRSVGATGIATPGIRARDPSDVFADKIVRSLGIIRHMQHPNGEILSYRRDSRGNYIYCRSPFASAFVHDALECFDPRGLTVRTDALSLFPTELRTRCARTVTDIRQRIRAFLIWQQEPEGYWRFFGRGSGIDPDVNTTAWASLACDESYGSRSPMRWQRQVDIVNRFRSAEGLYYTFFKPGRGGYGWLDDHGYPVVGHDRVVNAEVARFLLSKGDHASGGQLIDRLLIEAEGSGLDAGSPLYPNSLAFVFSLARAWHTGRIDGEDRLRAVLLPWIRQHEESDWLDRPLSAALATAALWYLGAEKAELEEGRRAVLRGLQPGGGWKYEDLVIHGFGSPAVTTALSMWVLAHAPPTSHGGDE